MRRELVQSVGKPRGVFSPALDLDAELQQLRALDPRAHAFERAMRAFHVPAREIRLTSARRPRSAASLRSVASALPRSQSGAAASGSPSRSARSASTLSTVR